MPKLMGRSPTGLPIYARTPGRHARFNEDGTVAVEPSNDPHSMRVYVRDYAGGEWSEPHFMPRHSAAAQFPWAEIGQGSE